MWVEQGNINPIQKLQWHPYQQNPTDNKHVVTTNVLVVQISHQLWQRMQMYISCVKNPIAVADLTMYIYIVMEILYDLCNIVSLCV